MTMTTATVQKQLAIDQHSVQASEFADRYQQFLADPYQSCFTYSRYRLEPLLEPLLPRPGAHLLDVGCGTGHHLARLRECGYTAAGVDGSPEMLAKARQQNPGADIRLADVEALPFADAQFDGVVCIEVLRYLPSPEQCVREMARVLKPGGVALVTAAPLLNLNGYWLVNRVANLVPVGNLVRLKQFFCTSGQLRRVFRRAGFADIQVRGVYLGPINWVERLTPWALPRFLKIWEGLDRATADRFVLREFANMFLVHAVKSCQGTNGE